MGLELRVVKSSWADCGFALFAFKIVSAGVEVKDFGQTQVTSGDPEPSLCQIFGWNFFKRLDLNDFFRKKK